MEDQFTRLRYLIGDDKLQLLKQKSIAVFGLGGVGGNVCDALVRSGIGRVDLFDCDKVTITNLNRQLIATSKTIGLDKVDVMKEHLLSINDQVVINVNKTFLLPDNIDTIDFSVYDYVVDAIDTISTKIAIITKCDQEGIKVISSMGTGNKLNPLDLEVSDIYQTSVCPLAKVMRYELKKRGIKHLKVVYSKELPIKVHIMNENNKAICGSSAFVPSVAGIIIASEIVKDLIKKRY